MIDEEACEHLKQEYEALRRRLESAELAQVSETSTDNPERSLDYTDLHIDEGDLRRFQVIRQRLMDECGEELPGDASAEVDIPKYVLDNLAQK